MTPASSSEAAENGSGPSRISSGNPQIDSVLSGGFPANSINIVMGQPGTGKTVFAEQLVFHNAADDRSIVYFTTMSEPASKVVRYLQNFHFYDENKLGTSVVYEDLGGELAREGIAMVMPRVKDAIRTLSPKIIVIDSYKALNDLTSDGTQLRHLTYELTGLLTAYDTTAFLLGEYSERDLSSFPEFAAADGIVELSRRPLGSRDERFFRVIKLRGSSYREGTHAFRITPGGLELFPRLVSPPLPAGYALQVERVPTGVEGLDEMTAGGFWRGSSTLLAGPSGAGKTTIGLQFVLAGARAGEPGLFLNFQENPTQLARALESLGVRLEGDLARNLDFMYTSPVELQIDSVIVELFRRIRENGVQRLVVDALTDLSGSATDMQRFHEYLYALIQHLIVNNITSVLTTETVADDPVGTSHGAVSALSDNFLALGMTVTDRTRRTLRVVKTRGSPHDPRVREFEIKSTGVHLI